MREIKVFYIASITFLISCSPTFAQDVTWFPENAEWYYTIQCLSDPLCGHLYYYTDGDTVVAGELAVRVRSQRENNEAQYFLTDTYFFREENDTVFYFSDSTNAWGMLYDFSAQPGDVWDLTETLLDITPTFSGEIVEARVEVDSVTTEMLEGMMRRVIHTSPLYNEEEMEPESEWMFLGPIVEGIGPVGFSRGLFGGSVAQLPGGYTPHFSCYREDDQLVYGSSNLPCGVVSSLTDKEVQEMSVFPNPTDNHVRLQLPSSFSFQADVTIYNVSGQVVARHQNFNASQPLNLPQSPGLYLIECRNGSRIARSRVVVQ